MDTATISVCIPAYKKASQLEALLDSLLMQDFRDFEVIVSDDSPDDSIRQVCEKYKQQFSLQYHHNKPALGSPENWNNAIRLAKGQWIKIMHDDDLFAGPDCLRKMYELTKGGAGFVFSGYNIVEGGQIRETHAISASWLNKIRRDPRLLIVHNAIGHPSVALHRNQNDILYDSRMKWMVDIDFYIRCLQNGNFSFTADPLINIGRHEEQITRSVFTNKQVVISENLLLLNKLGAQLMNYPAVYDYCWRLLRNYAVKDAAELQSLSSVPVPVTLIKMLHFQRRFPAALIKWGPVSKLLMLLSWLVNR